MSERFFGVKCSVCVERLPRAYPKALQPSQLCRTHKPHHRDQRLQPKNEEWTAAMSGDSHG